MKGYVRKQAVHPLHAVRKKQERKKNIVKKKDDMHDLKAF